MEAPLPPLPVTRPTAGGTGETVDVRLAFAGVSNQYRHYFREAEFTEPLGQGLGACFDEWVDVVVAYDNEARQGRIFVQTPGERLGCRPLVTNPGLDARPLAPIGQALARYRDALAANRDFRLANFETGIRVVDGVQICDLWTAGQHPPDGTTFSACVTLQGHDVCDGDRDEGHARIPWPATRAADLKACFE
ncbi:MAG: hypothetical protein AAGA48_02705 [Myxococcota bacterium]